MEEMARRNGDMEASPEGRLMQEDEETQTSHTLADKSNGHSPLDFKVDICSHEQSTSAKTSPPRLRICLIAVLVLLMLAGIAVAAYLLITFYDDSGLVDVKTTTGTLRGRRVASPSGVKVEEYLGVPFAEPPVGQLRYSDPVPIAHFPNEPYEALDYQNSCIQYLEMSMGDFPGIAMWNAENPLSEDCLYLNVWSRDRGDIQQGELKPVMVWIYGGGFYSGSNALWVYDGKALAAFGDVIVASLNYRVGTFGYLTTGDGRIKGNFGMKDQVEALKWIKQNAAVFGGDPERITIFGESSGASSAGLHMMSTSAQHLFQRAIFESGSPDAHWSFMSQAQARERSGLFFSNVNCTMEETDELLQCLRGLSASFILNNEWVDSHFMVFPWAPSVDGDYLTDSPYNLLKSGKYQKKDSLLGVNKDEGSFWILFALPGLSKDHASLQNHTTFSAALPTLNWDLTSAEHDRVRRMYAPSDPGDLAGYTDALDKVCGDRSFTCPTLNLADELCDDGDVSTYFYYLTYRASNEVWPPWMGVIHGAEIQWAFGMPHNKSRGFTDEEVKFSEMIMSYWVNFAKTGDPNGPSLHEWPAYTKHDRKFLEFRSAEEFLVNATLRQTQCDFWKEMADKYSGPGMS